MLMNYQLLHGLWFELLFLVEREIRREVNQIWSLNRAKLVGD